MWYTEIWNSVLLSKWDWFKASGTVFATWWASANLDGILKTITLGAGASVAILLVIKTWYDVKKSKRQAKNQDNGNTNND